MSFSLGVEDSPFIHNFCQNQGVSQAGLSLVQFNHFSNCTEPPWAEHQRERFLPLLHPSCQTYPDYERPCFFAALIVDKNAYCVQHTPYYWNKCSLRPLRPVPYLASLYIVDYANDCVCFFPRRLLALFSQRRPNSEVSSYMGSSNWSLQPGSFEDFIKIVVAYSEKQWLWRHWEIKIRHN